MTTSISVFPLVERITRAQEEKMVAQALALREAKEKLRLPPNAEDLPSLQPVTASNRPLPLLSYLKDSMGGPAVHHGKRLGFKIQWEELVVLNFVEQLQCGSPLDQENAANGLRILAVEKRLPTQNEVLELAIVDVVEKLRTLRPDSARDEAAYARSLLLFILNMMPEQLPTILAAEYVPVLTNLVQYHKDDEIATEAARVLIKLALLCLESTEGFQSAFLTLQGKPALMTLLENTRTAGILTDSHLASLIRLLESPTVCLSRWAGLMLLKSTILTKGDGKISVNVKESRRLAKAGAEMALMDAAVAATKEERACFLTAVGNLLSLPEAKQEAVPEPKLHAFVEAVVDCAELWKEPAIYVFSGLAKNEGSVRALARPEVVQLLLEVALDESYGKNYGGVDEGAIKTCPLGLRASATLCALACSRDSTTAASTAAVVPNLLSKLFLANGFGGKAKERTESVNRREELPFDIFITSVSSLRGDIGCMETCDLLPLTSEGRTGPTKTILIN